jgi:hypothetical protein
MVRRFDAGPTSAVRRAYASLGGKEDELEDVGKKSSSAPKEVSLKYVGRRDMAGLCDGDGGNGDEDDEEDEEDKDDGGSGVLVGTVAYERAATPLLDAEQMARCSGTRRRCIEAAGAEAIVLLFLDSGWTQDCR